MKASAAAAERNFHVRPPVKITPPPADADARRPTGESRSPTPPVTPAPSESTNETLTDPSDRRSITIASPRRKATMATEMVPCSCSLRRNSGHASRPAASASPGVQMLPDTRQMPCRSAPDTERASGGTAPLNAKALVTSTARTARSATYSREAWPVLRERTTPRVGRGRGTSPRENRAARGGGGGGGAPRGGGGRAARARGCCGRPPPPIRAAPEGAARHPPT